MELGGTRTSTGAGGGEKKEEGEEQGLHSKWHEERSWERVHEGLTEVIGTGCRCFLSFST